MIRGIQTVGNPLSGRNYLGLAQMMSRAGGDIAETIEDRRYKKDMASVLGGTEAPQSLMSQFKGFVGGLRGAGAERGLGVTGITDEPLNLRQEEKIASLNMMKARYPERAQQIDGMIGQIQKQAFSADMEAARKDPEKMEALYAKYPAYAASIDRLSERIGMSNKKTADTQLSRVKFAIERDDFTTAKKVLQDHAAILVSSGMNEQAAMVNEMVEDMTPENKDKALRLVDELGTRVVGKDWMDRQAQALSLESGKLTIKKVNQELKNLPTRLKIENARLENENKRLDIQLAKELRQAESDGIDTDADKKTINDLSDKLIEAHNIYGKSTTALGKIGALEKTGGVSQRLGAAVDRFLGLKPEEQNLIRQELERLTTSEIINNLPKGPASDKDIEIVSRGFPQAGARKEEYEAYFKASKRIAEKARAYYMAKKDYLSQNKAHAGNAHKDMNIRMLNGESIKVPKGSDFDYVWITQVDKLDGSEPVQEDIEKVTPPPGSKVRKFNPQTGRIE